MGVCLGVFSFIFFCACVPVCACHMNGVIKKNPSVDLSFIVRGLVVMQFVSF